MRRSRSSSGGVSSWMQTLLPESFIIAHAGRSKIVLNVVCSVCGGLGNQYFLLSLNDSLTHGH